MGTEPVRVAPVDGRRQLAEFIRLPRRLYAQDPNWVPPLALERRQHFSSRNPWCAHAHRQLWLAWREGRPVGRISAQVDELHRCRHVVNSGHFGFLDCENNPQILGALLETSEEWLRQQRTEVVTGPFNFSINQECGLLVDGFDAPPSVMMPHNPPWYGAALEQQGYAAARDLYAYWLRCDFPIPPVMQTLVDRYGGRIALRPLNRKNFRQELETIREIFNDAWADNWGFVPFTRKEFAALGAALRLFVPEDFICIAECQGTPAAFIVVLPNLNEVLKELDGRLLPLGWLRLLQSLRKSAFKTGRTPLMGVRKQFQNTPLGIALAFLVIHFARQAAVSRGMEHVELSWILEDNQGMRNILERIGGRLYKTYRIYRKQL